jgi:hypothetical protein
MLHKAYKYKRIIFPFHFINTFSPSYHSSSYHPIHISLNNFLTPFPLQLCSWECRVAPVFGLISLLQDPVNHISGNSKGCLDTPFGTMHHAIVPSCFLKFFLFFPSSRFYLTFFLACFGHCTPWFQHFSWFTSRAISLPPAPLYYPTFLKCYILYPRRKNAVISPEMSEYFYQATQSYIPKSSIHRRGVVSCCL